MLPEGFEWKPRHLSPEERDLYLYGRLVAQLRRRLDGSWFALLDRWEPITAPLRARECRSRESGIAGIEAWARRHEARLRATVERMPRPVHRGAGLA